MMETYQRIVAAAIILTRPDLDDVRNIVSIQNLWFSQELYPAIKASIEKLDLTNLPHADRKDGELREYLDISRFEDASGNKYIVTIYDSDELWQDPEILDIWKIDMP